MDPEVIGPHVHLLDFKYVIGPLITLVITLIAGAFAYGKLTGKVKEIETNNNLHKTEAEKKFDTLTNDITQKLVRLEVAQSTIRSIGLPSRYVSMGDCDAMHEDCRKELCGRLVNITEAIGQLQRAQTTERQQINEFMNKISVFIGTVNEFMRSQDRRHENIPYNGPDKRNA
jgi:hypothetical protein